MGGTHSQGGTAKSASIKVVKLNVSEDDLKAAQIARLAEIQAECERNIPTNLVHLCDIAQMLGLSETNKVTRRAKKLKIKTYLTRRGDSNNKHALCVTEEDAERIIRSYYES